VSPPLFVPKAATALDVTEKARFGAWLLWRVEVAMADDPTRSRRQFMRECLGDADYSSARVSKHFEETLPMPELLRAMCAFWNIHLAEAFFRAGYFREFFSEVLAFERRDATRALIAFFPLRGERPKFAGPLFDDHESVSDWLGLTVPAAPPLRRRRALPYLLRLAANASLDRQLERDVRRFTAAHYVREFVFKFHKGNAVALIQAIHDPSPAAYLTKKSTTSPYVIPKRQSRKKKDAET
jgi:hypothetical protein